MNHEAEMSGLFRVSISGDGNETVRAAPELEDALAEAILGHSRCSSPPIELVANVVVWICQDYLNEEYEVDSDRLFGDEAVIAKLKAFLDAASEAVDAIDNWRQRLRKCES